MSFFDDIKNAQNQGQEERIKRDAESRIQKNKALQDFIKKMCHDIKTQLLYKAKNTSPDEVFSYDGFIGGTSLYGSEDIFHQDNPFSLWGPLTITLTPLGKDILKQLQTELAPDQIKVLSFCCREGDTLKCLELPVVVKYRIKRTTAIWDLKASNKHIKLQSDCFDTKLIDKVRFGVHVIYNH